MRRPLPFWLQVRRRALPGLHGTQYLRFDCHAGLPTVNDYTTMPSTPTWTFVSGDYRKKQQHR